MEYFIPAWHEDNSDWAVAIPSITILDATSHMRILQNNGHQVGIIISTYEPGLMTRLNQLIIILISYFQFMIIYKASII
ncbi:MAG: hypothetical protein E7H42_05645 [Lactobacillus paragasseri]|uniref:hypothetical protein n=1 Tax=Lactobacillus TaxID=1578 RepID=UPI001E59E331|nr:MULTISPECIES: hypothetical protein [Lactobacillus]MDU8979579.1 hypothetical protein [Lactobacillus paragasseri]WRS89554.1 hypothetical protein VA644_02885 [Lactobacillus gasseri]